MGATKEYLFSPEQNQLSKVFTVLGHSARIAILQELIDGGSSTNGQLSFTLQLAQSTISQHLNELKEVELIKGTVIGTSIVYQIDSSKWNETKESIRAFLNCYG